MTWRSRALELPRGEAAAEQTLVGAYRSVFREGQDAEMVLADMAAFTGFYQVQPPGDMSAYQAGYVNGMRAAFGRLFHFLSLSDRQLAELEEAARLEASIINQG